jgi:PAS domain S-box-containing protein
METSPGDRLAENLNHSSEAMFAAIFEASPNSIAVTRVSDHCLTEVNAGFLSLTGYSREEVVGRTSKDLGLWDNRNERDAYWKIQLQQETARNFPFVLRARSGELKNCRISGRRIRIQGQEYVIAVVVDITEQKRAEEELRKSEEQYRSLFERMLNGFAYCRIIFEEGRPRDFIYLAVNRAFESLTGLRDVTGKRVSEVIPGIQESDPEIFEIYGRVARTGTPETFERYVQALKMWFTVSVYCPGQDHFVAIFDVITERKRAEEELRATYGNLGLVLNSAQAGIWDWDIPTGKLTWSKEFLELFGLAPETQPSFEAWRTVLYPDDREPAERRIEQSIRERTPLENEYRIVLPDGNVHWISAKGTTYYDPSGRPLRMCGICIDITSRKRVEDALRESETRFRMVVESAPEAIFVQSGGRFLYLNSACIRLFNVDRTDALVGGELMKWIAPEYHEIVRERIRLQRETGRAAPLCEQQYLRSDGSRVWVETTAVPMQFQGKEAHLVFVRDITARKQAEETAQTLSRRQEAILAAVPDIIAEVDANKVYTWMNKAGLEFFGEDALGREAAYYFEGQQDTYTKVQPLFNGDPDVIYLESWQRRRDGVKRLLAWWCRVIKDAAGNVTGALSTAHDITEIRHSEEALRDSETKYRSLAEHSFDGIGISEGNRVLWTNQTLARMFGYDSVEEFIRIPLLDPVTPASRDLILRRMESRAKGENPPPIFEFQIIRKDGVIRDMEVSTSEISIEGQSMVQSAFRDITERKQREEAEQRAIEEAGQFSSGLVHLHTSLSRHVRLVYHPVARAGGDGICVFPVNRDRFVVVVYDVSGHDLKSAFVAAFFQGTAHGMMRAGRSITDVLNEFNHYLQEHWPRIRSTSDKSPEMRSLAVAVLDIDLKRRRAELINHGLPFPLFVDGEGRMEEMACQSMPLGWKQRPLGCRRTLRIDDDSVFFLRTDGVDALAAQANSWHGAVIPRLLTTGEEERRHLVHGAEDDILLMAVTTRVRGRDDRIWTPVFHGRYGGDQLASIDQFEVEWKRSLRCACPGLPDELLDKILMCGREALLNAMEHGARKRPRAECVVQMTLRLRDGRLRMRVEDPGRGIPRRDFLRKVENIGLQARHRGLLMIRNLAKQVHTAKENSTIIMDFTISPAGAKVMTEREASSSASLTPTSRSQPSMQHAYESATGTLNVRLRERLLSTTVETICHEISTLMNAKTGEVTAWKCLNLDLQEVGMIDSTGLNLIASLVRECRQRKARIEAEVRKGMIHESLLACGLSREFDSLRVVA